MGRAISAITRCYPERPPVRGGGRPYPRASRTGSAGKERLQQRAGVLIVRFNSATDERIVALRSESEINLAAYDRWLRPDEAGVFGRSDVAHKLSKDNISGRSIQGVEIAIAASHIDGERS